MSKGNITGWKDVFSFTLKQNAKNKVLRVTTLILLIIAVAAVPVIMAFGESDDSTKDAFTVDVIYVADTTGSLMPGIQEIFGTDDRFANTTFLEANDADKIVDQLKNESSSDKKEMLMKIEYTEGAYTLTFTYGENTGLSRLTLEDIGDYINENFRKVIVSSYDLTPEAMELINKPVISRVENVSSLQKAEDTSGELTQREYNVSITFIMICIFLLAFGGEAIASSIVTEKSSKVIELLMTSIKPMAIVIGKVFAALVVILTQFTVVILGFLGSSIITNSIKSGEFVGFRIPSEISDMFTDILGTTEGIWYKLIIILVLIALGFVFFGVIAALAGATISKMDELAEGVKIYSMILVISAYICMAILMAGNIGSGAGGIVNAVLVIPFTSIFLLPGYLLLGKASVGTALIAILIQAAAIILLFKFVSNVYEYLIYHKGSPVKIKQIISISKQNSKTKKKGADRDE